MSWAGRSPMGLRSSRRRSLVPVAFRHARIGAVVLLGALALATCIIAAPRAFVSGRGLQSGGVSAVARPEENAPHRTVLYVQRSDGFETDRIAADQSTPSWLASSAAAFMLLVVAVVVGRPSTAVADSRSMAAVAPCLLSQCQLPLAKCIANPGCAANLTCILGCTGAKDEASCQIKCGDNFENEVVDEFNSCALSAKKCVPQRPESGPLPTDKNWNPANSRYPVPPPGSVTQEFDVTKMTGRWFITAGLNPLFDDFDCQVHFFDGYAPKGNEPGRLVGKINWRIGEPDGEYVSKSTVQSFIQSEPGVLLNHGNEYLHYQDDWYVLDHENMDDPELGWVLIYYRGQNDAWANYGGGTLYTRARTTPPQILDRVRAACAKANVPFDKYWKFTDNSCKGVVDPIQLRTQFANKILRQAELSAEEQLTILSRSTISAVDKEEKLILQSAERLEKMTEDFAQKEIKEIRKELALVSKEVKKDLVLAEKELEKDELALEAPVRQLMGWFKQPAKK